MAVIIPHLCVVFSTYVCTMMTSHQQYISNTHIVITMSITPFHYHHCSGVLPYVVVLNIANSMKLSLESSASCR